MKIVMFGDSITDMGHSGEIGSVQSYGAGYPFVVYGKMCEENPLKHQVINKGVSGNRIVDLYARIKSDVWNLNPDVLSILIGINDVWHEIAAKNGVDIKRFERVYRAIISDTTERLPNVKIMLMEPFVLHGTAVDEMGFDKFNEIRKYAQVIKGLAKEYNLIFVPLQKTFDEAALKYGAEACLFDGVHTTVFGATLIANEWLKYFKQVK